MKRHFAIAVALGTSLAAGIASTTAVAAQDPQTCAQIEDSLRRLDCFDRMFPEDATEKPAGDEPAAKSPWQIREERSPIDDSPTVVALLPPTDVSFTGIGDGEVFLIIRCAENTTAIFLSTNMFMTPDQVSVTTRIDSETAETSRWNRSSNYKAVGLWNGASAIPFVKRLADGTKLAVRIEADDVITAEFGLGDVSPQVDKIRAACNW